MLKITIFLFTILFSFKHSTAISQQIKVYMRNMYGLNNVSNDYRPAIPVKNYSLFKGVDSSKYSSWKIRSSVFSSIQSLKEDVLKKTITHESFIDFTSKYDIDTSYGAYEIIRKNKVASLIGLDEKGTKYVTVDANNDLDFSNDSIYIFDKINRKLDLPSVIIDFEYFDKEVKKGKFPFYIDAYSVPEGQPNIDLVMRSYKKGLLTINSNLYEIQISNSYFDIQKNYKYLMNIRRIPIDSTANNNYFFERNQLIEFNGKDMYHVDSLTKDTLYLSFHHTAIYEGAKVNTVVPDILSRSYISNELFSLRAQKGSYVVIDFWGSWCKPCIEALPELVSLQNKYKRNGLKVLSLAYDDAANIIKLKSIIKEKNLDWFHVFINKKNKKDTTMSNYKVQSFPSVFLVNPQGIIVVRGEGAKGLSMVADQLEGIFKKRQN